VSVPDQRGSREVTSTCPPDGPAAADNRPNRSSGASTLSKTTSQRENRSEASAVTSARTDSSAAPTIPTPARSANRARPASAEAGSSAGTRPSPRLGKISQTLRVTGDAERLTDGRQTAWRQVDARLDLRGPARQGSAAGSLGLSTSRATRSA